MPKGWLVLASLVAILLLVAGCSPASVNPGAGGPAPSSTNPTEELRIGEIKANPEFYQGKLVEISGEYQGWKSPDGTGPPVTRSDWIMKDATGWIYVTGIYPDLDPIKDLGRRVVVCGKVMVKDAIAYIEATQVEG